MAETFWKAFFKSEADRDNYLRFASDTVQLGDTLYQAVVRITSHSVPIRDEPGEYFMRSTFLALTLSGDLVVVKTEFFPQNESTLVKSVKPLRKKDKHRLYLLLRGLQSKVDFC